MIVVELQLNDVQEVWDLMEIMSKCADNELLDPVLAQRVWKRLAVAESDIVRAEMDEDGTDGHAVAI